MLDHIGIKTGRLAESMAFYDAVFEALGGRKLFAWPQGAVYGDADAAVLSVSAGEPALSSFHFAFSCRDRSAVDRFHAAALTAGGRDNGPPGLRANYAPGYYAAFVFDPDGNNVEAVCHEADDNQGSRQ